MLVIPFALNAHEYSVFVVLGDDNLERIKQYDPAQLRFEEMAAFRHKRLRTVLIGYGDKEDVQRVAALAGEGKLQEALQYLSRGFKFQPERGDYDGPYLNLLQKKGEPKQ